MWGGGTEGQDLLGLFPFGGWRGMKVAALYLHEHGECWRALGEGEGVLTFLLGT